MNKMTKVERVLSTIMHLCCVSVLILVIMQLLDIWENAINIFEPLLGVVILVQSILIWKKNRRIAILGLCSALIIFTFAFIIFFVE